jgi:hypothetical protein
MVSSHLTESTLVDLHHGSTSESWVVVYADGRLTYHIENEGPRVLRHGTEPLDEDVDLAFIRQHYPHRVADVEAALKSLRRDA